MDIVDVISGTRRFKNFSAKEIEEATGISSDKIGRFDNRSSAHMNLSEIDAYARAVGLEISVTITGIGTQWTVPLVKTEEA